MNTKENRLGVALAKEACPVCGKLQDGPILMNTILTERRAKEVEALHGQTIGFMDEPCEECKLLMERGFVLVGVVREKTDDESNPYRSGEMWVIKREAAERMFPEKYLEKGVAFIDSEDAKALGLRIFKDNPES